MGWVMMSERELNRIEVLAQVNDGRLSAMDGALLLDLSKRQVFRLLGRFREDGAAGHRWFEDRAPACTLLVFVDDASSTLMHLQFVRSESTFSYFAALETYLANHGRPVAFYSDRHTVFRAATQGARTGHGMTRLGGR